MAPRRNELTLNKKIDVIKFAKLEKCGVRKLAEKFNISKTYAANILKSEADLLKQASENGNLNRIRKFPKGNSTHLNKIVFEWFCMACASRIAITGPLLQEKAREIAKLLNIENFKATNGWLDRFRQRHKISFKSIYGAAGDVNLEIVANWKENVANIIKGYSPEDIWNLDECGLFFRVRPNKTFCLKNEKCAAGQISTDRLTVMFCVSLASEKETPLVIGNSEKPRCFHGIDVANLGVTYKSNKNAWMTQEIMSEWLMQFDRKMQRKGRKVLLFLDNARSRPTSLTLTNVKLVFFPANCTSVIQPLNQGIIENFKVKYRQLMLRNVIATLDNANDLNTATVMCKSINILDAICWITKAWCDVKQNTILKCFRKAGIITEDTQESVGDDEDNLDLTVLRDLLIGVGNSAVIEKYVAVDAHLHTENNSLEIATIIEKHIADEPEDVEDGNGDELNTIEDEDADPKSYKEAIEQIKQIKRFLLKKGDVNNLVFINNFQQHMETVCCTHALSQAK